MFIKRFITAVAVVAAACVSIPEAKAGLDHTAIAAKLRSIGVTTSYGDCGSNVHGEVLGSYNSGSNHFCISNKISDVNLFDETVIHEVVHVLQDCVGDGIGSADMGSLTAWLSGGDTVKEEAMDNKLIADLHKRNKLSHVDKWTSHLNENNKWIEREAYYFETSPLFVLKMLDQCNSK